MRWLPFVSDNLTGLGKHLAGFCRTLPKLREGKELKTVKMARSGCGTAMLVLATVMGPIVLIFLSVSFATDHWLEFDVSRGQLSPTIRSDSENSVVLARYTHTRHRGLFRECYPGNDTKCK